MIPWKQTFVSLVYSWLVWLCIPQSMKFTMSFFLRFHTVLEAYAMDANGQGKTKKDVKDWQDGSDSKGTCHQISVVWIRSSEPRRRQKERTDPMQLWSSEFHTHAVVCELLPPPLFLPTPHRHHNKPLKFKMKWIHVLLSLGVCLVLEHEFALPSDTNRP